MIDRRRVFAVVFALVVWASVEGTAALGLRLLETRYGIVDEVLSQDQRDQLRALLRGAGGVRHDARLGWVPRPGLETRTVHINAQGVRRTEPIGPLPAEGVLRIATFGCSFTFGAEVDDDETWQAAMERARPDAEVLNFGVGGYGPDQAYLRSIRDAAGVRPHVVLLGYLDGSHSRLPMVFWPFRGKGIPMAKPRFRLEGDGLVLVENPMDTLEDYEHLLQRPDEVLPLLGEHDLYFQGAPGSRGLGRLPSVRLVRLAARRDQASLFWGPDRQAVREEARRILFHLVDRFYRDVRAIGAVPVFVVFPSREDIDLWRQGGRRGTEHAALSEYLEGRADPSVDLLQELGEATAGRELGTLFEAGAHYTPGTNELVGRLLWDALRRHDLDTVEGARRALAEE